MGVHYMEKEQYDLAEEHLERALHLSPKNNNKGSNLVKLRLAFIRARNGEFENAHKLLQESRAGLQEFPMYFVHVHIFAFDIALFEGCFDAAQAALKSMLECAKQLNLTRDSSIAVDIKERERRLTERMEAS